jgi:hypothetical protein
VFWRAPERLRLAVWPHLGWDKRNARYRLRKGHECYGTRQPGRAAGGTCGQAAVAGAIPVRNRGRPGLLPLTLLQRCRRGRPFGSMRCDLGGRLALAVMSGCLVLMADMGLGNRGRERKHDQDDRRSQNSHNLLLWHDGSIVAQVSLRYRRGTGNSRSPGKPDPRHSSCFARPGRMAKPARAAITRTYALSTS